ncbi:MAG: FAD-binding protein [Coxiellaceae bacterium]|nr:FAD-binding protein [Coxiellaceae bacterium]
MMILVIAEHNNTELKASTLNCVSAAKLLADDIHVLVAGDQCAAVAEQCATITGVSAVWHCDNSAYLHPLAETVAPLIAEHVKSQGYSHVVMAASSLGKDTMPRAAAILDVGQVSDIISIESADTFKRPIYAGNAIATVKSLDVIKCMTVRVSAFDKAACDQAAVDIKVVEFTPEAVSTEWVNDQLSNSDRPELSDASIVISGGRGLKDKETFAQLAQIADKLGAAMGASRAAVDAGMVANELQVGQTGQIVAPDLYIAVGISGAIQHLAGMKDSKVIVAINSDADAPIFQVADYGLVADLFTVLPELQQRLGD